MNKLGTAIGGLLLIGALVAPVAFAHTDNGATAVSGLVSLTPTANQNRVSGVYYTASSLVVGICDAPFPADGGPDCTPAAGGFANPANAACGAITDPALNAACNDATSPLGPGFRFTSLSGVVADAEVGGLGTCGDLVLDNTNTQNEFRIDGTPGQGSVTDGTWNDGGIGFVSHTDHYDCANDGPNADGVGPAGEDWNTLGCGYLPAKADDAVSDNEVWLFTTCSWGKASAVGGQGLDAVILQFLGDIPNCVLGGFPQSCVDNVQYLDDCGLDNQVDNALTNSPPTVCAGATVSIVCGAGAVSSDNFGDGGFTAGGTAFIGAGNDNDPATPYPDCDAFATASVFPISGIILEADPVTGLPNTVFDLSVASVGIIY